MDTLIVVLSVVLIFLIGAWLIAFIITERHGDTSASYPLFAVRDKIIDAVVFGGVARDNPYIEAMYENVNSILFHSNLVAGPERWDLAAEVGRHLEKHPEDVKDLRPWPKGGDPSQPLVPVMHELCQALDYLLTNHTGIVVQMHEASRLQRRLQKEKAKKLRDMVQSTPSFDDCALE